MKRSFFQTNLYIILCIFTCWSSTATSQTDETISLLADSIYLNQSDSSLVAVGNVQVFFENSVLTATKISYDPNGGGIIAEGPITLTDDYGSVLIADFALLDSDLKSGLIRGAKLLFEQELQFAAAEVVRTDGRFNTLNNAVASACQVCLSRPVPVWRIRARQVIHDSQELQIHFRDATLDVFGIPVFYSPYMRIPDPSVRRATGFLTPVFLSSDFFGGGLKIPYYIVLSKYSDLTITSTASISGVVVVDADLRQRFSNGRLEAFGALSLNDEHGDYGRGYFTTNGTFNILQDVTLRFDATIPSDDGFMNQYGYDNTDRLVSEISLSRYRNRSYFSLAGAVLTSLRDDENNAQIPYVLPEFTYRGYRTDPVLGGKIGYDIDALGLIRRDGQDVVRFGGGVDWNVPIDLPFGIRAASFAAVDFDVYQVWDSNEFSNLPIGAIYPSLGAEIRWPLARTTENFRHVLEPVIQLVYTAEPGFNNVVPNEDSLQVEFDETNLFDVNRFPGRDVSETGFRANLGATYALYADEGWSVGLAAGVVLRSAPSEQFPTNSLLGSSQSDFLGAVSFNFAPNFNIQGRFLFDDQLDFKRSETQFSLNFENWDIDGTLLYLAPDILAQSSNERGEGKFAARYRFADNWEASFKWQRDLLEDRNVSAGFGLIYGNECIEIGINLSQKYTKSTTVTPSTDVKMFVDLTGFGGNQSNDWPAQRCIR